MIPPSKPPSAVDWRDYPHHEKSTNASPVPLTGNRIQESRPCTSPGKYSRDGSEGKGMDATAARVQELESYVSFSQAVALGRVGHEP